MDSLEYKIGQLVEKLDTLVDQMKTERVERAEAHKELELRVRSLEESRSRFKGWAAAATAIGAVLGWIVSFLTK